MNIIHALILGIVEGLTEFLPVSSTAHLIFASKILQISQTDFQKFFEVFIQLGAILAVALIYAKELVTNKRLLVTLAYSFIPTAVVGLVMYKVIKNVFFEAYGLIIFVFIAVGIIFIVQELWLKSSKHKVKSMSVITPVHAVMIGLAQALAVIPGVSRSGIVIVALLFLDYKRDESAKYSFLLALPTITAASLYDLYKSRQVIGAAQGNLPALVIGFVVSFLVAYVAMKWFISFLQTNSLTSFGIYRIVAGVLFLVLLQMGM